MEMRKLAAIVTVALAMAAVALPSCGGGSTSSTPVTTTTTLPCTQAILFQGGGTQPARALVRVPFTIVTTARLDVIFDWTIASNLFGLYVVSAGSCPIEQFNAGSCNFLMRSETATKPRKVSVPDIPPGSYQMLVANYGSQDDSVTTQIIQSTSSCAPLSLAPVTAAGVAPRPPVRAVGRY